MVALSKGAGISYITKKMDESNFVKIKTRDRVKLFCDAIMAQVVAIDKPYGNIWTQIKPSDLKNRIDGRRLTHDRYHQIKNKIKDEMGPYIRESPSRC